ncbi:MAG TPA: type II CAAX endopeptidase family protein [Tissierellales bacterium]|nr:type II CAAX endopeptidase family protein [Tissierellales bacterium]
MEGKVLTKERKIYKVNLFFMLTLIWSLVAEFLPIHSNLYQYIAFLIPICIYTFRNKEATSRIFKFNKIGLKSLFIVFIIWLSMLPISIIIISFYTNYFGKTMPDLVIEASKQSNLELLIFTAITPAILEELLMRGIILDGYRNKNRLSAALINGFMFGILHLNTFQFSHTFVSGTIASYLVFATNSIFSAIFFHFVNNSAPVFIDIIIKFLFPKDNEVVQSDYNHNYKYPIILVFISLLIIIGLIYLLAKINNVDFKKQIGTSNEVIFNKPLIISIIIFIMVNIMLILTIKLLM